MGTNNLKVKVVHLDDAPDYNETDFKGLNFDSALVVKEGTTEGKPTIDLKFTDRDGNEYVAMTTGSIIQMLAGVIEGAK